MKSKYLLLLFSGLCFFHGGTEIPVVLATEAKDDLKNQPSYVSILQEAAENTKEVRDALIALERAQTTPGIEPQNFPVVPVEAIIWLEIALHRLQEATLLAVREAQSRLSQQREAATEGELEAISNSLQALTDALDTIGNLTETTTLDFPQHSRPDTGSVPQAGRVVQVPNDLCFAAGYSNSWHPVLKLDRDDCRTPEQRKCYDYAQKGPRAWAVPFDPRQCRIHN